PRSRRLTSDDADRQWRTGKVDCCSAAARRPDGRVRHARSLGLANSPFATIRSLPCSYAVQGGEFATSPRAGGATPIQPRVPPAHNRALASGRMEASAVRLLAEWGVAGMAGDAQLSPRSLLRLEPFLRRGLRGQLCRLAQRLLRLIALDLFCLQGACRQHRHDVGPDLHESAIYKETLHLVAALDAQLTVTQPAHHRSAAGQNPDLAVVQRQGSEVSRFVDDCPLRRDDHALQGPG